MCFEITDFSQSTELMKFENLCYKIYLYETTQNSVQFDKLRDVAEKTGLSQSAISQAERKAIDHRLIVAVAFRLGAVYIKFIGTHAEYDRINADEVEL